MKFLGVTAVILTGICLCGLSEARNITYLPRDQELQSVSQNYSGSGYQLTELQCDAGGVATQMSRSMMCVAARLDCPDCCLRWSPLDANGRPTMMSTPLVDVSAGAPAVAPYYKQTEIIFDSNPNSACAGVRDCTLARPPFPKTNCSANMEISHCQERGCPGVDSDLNVNALPFLMSNAHECRAETPGDLTKWLCTNNAPNAPAFAGCTPLDNANKCNGPVYNKTFIGACPFAPARNCWRYEFKPAYRACVDKCINAAKGFEAYERDTDCLLNGDAVCPAGANGAGFLNNCVSYQCQERIDWPECKAPLGSPAHPLCCDNAALDAATIQEYQNTYNKCFDRDMREGGGCLDCFRPLGTADKPLQYDFIARSNHKAVAIWQLQVVPHYCVTSGTTCPSGNWDIGTVPVAYLYTTAKVFDITDGTEREIFPGTTTKGSLSQRAFAGAFSIFAATAIDKKDDGRTNFLEQGHRYRVKLFWYIPSIANAILKADVVWSQLTVIRTRD